MKNNNNLEKLVRRILIELYQNTGPQPGHINYGRFDKPIGKPIVADENASANSFEKLPPVDDPNYIPTSQIELRLAAYALTKNVRGEEMENFYNKLKRLIQEVERTEQMENFRSAKKKIHEARETVWPWPEGTPEQKADWSKKAMERGYYGSLTNPPSDIGFDPKTGLVSTVGGLKIEKEGPGRYEASIRDYDQKMADKADKMTFDKINTALGDVFKTTSGTRNFVKKTQLKSAILTQVDPAILDELMAHARIDFDQTLRRSIESGVATESDNNVNTFREFANRLYFDDIYLEVVNKDLRKSIYRYVSEEIFGFEQGFKARWMIDFSFKIEQVILQFEERIKQLSDRSMREWLDENFERKIPDEILSTLDPQDIEAFKKAITETTVDDIFAARTAEVAKMRANTIAKGMLQSTNNYLQTGQYLPKDIKDQNKAFVDAKSGKIDDSLKSNIEPQSSEF